MHDDGPPKQLNERSGKHVCVRCLAEVPADEFLRNDHICDDCAQTDEYPLKSTPEAKAEGGRKKDAGRRT